MDCVVALSLARCAAWATATVERAWPALDGHNRRLRQHRVAADATQYALWDRWPRWAAPLALSASSCGSADLAAAIDPVCAAHRRKCLEGLQLAAVDARLHSPAQCNYAPLGVWKPLSHLSRSAQSTTGVCST